jgi:hypothetical protein
MSGSATWAISIDQVQVAQWVGSGSNQALMVVDWQQPQTMVFGYRWEGSATGLSFIEAVASADIGFQRVWHPDFIEKSLFGLGYDVDGDGGAFTFGEPGLDTETGSAADSDDYYAEGWYTGYWARYDSQNGEDWELSALGLAAELAEGAWLGWSWSPAPDWNGGAPDNIPLLPEPASALLMLLGAAAVVKNRRQQG